MARLNEVVETRGKCGALHTAEYHDGTSHPAGYLCLDAFCLVGMLPTWLMPEDAPLVRAGARAFEASFGQPAQTGRWAFSTNGTYWNGVAGIPAIGFGPGDEATAHTALDSVPIQEVRDSADFYATLPLALDDLKDETDVVHLPLTPPAPRPSARLTP